MGDLAIGLKAIGAGLAIAIGAAGSGLGQGNAAAAGQGAIAENPDIFGKAVVLTAMPETQAIYSLIVAILIIVLLK